MCVPADCTVNTDYLVEVLPPKKALPLPLATVRGKFGGNSKPDYKNISTKTFNSPGDVAGGVSRLAENQAEVNAMMDTGLPSEHDSAHARNLLCLANQC